MAMNNANNPPLLEGFSRLAVNPDNQEAAMMESGELPIIDLSKLKGGSDESKVECMEKIARASMEWGFFQVVNHGVDLELLMKMRKEQKKLFQASFEKKSTCGTLNKSYKWGNPAATRTDQFSWSEAFHIPLNMVSDEASYGEFTSLKEVMVEYAAAMQELVTLLSGVLVMMMGRQEDTLDEICDEGSCFLRLNRYPVCPLKQETAGLVPHTDSDFLTILHQDEVGGLQLLKDNKWVAVKPNQHALIVNIGDLFQAWSNDVYKSVEHKVVANKKVERFSIAYFMCPTYDSLIGSCGEPSVYRNFTFGQYREKTQEDVKKCGYKVGLSQFRIQV